MNNPTSIAVLLDVQRSASQRIQWSHAPVARRPHRPSRIASRLRSLVRPRPAVAAAPAPAACA
jgi:hypothetical protein